MSEEIKQKHIPLSTFIPGYLITAKLGEGGMGAVYKATQLSLNREVAVKILSSEQNKDPEYVARFEREAQIAGKLNHKNIVSVLETGVSHHHHYYVMEYVEGASLNKILHKRKTLPEQEALKIIEEVAEALEHSDRYKIIHRDIKPDNIMLTNDGHAKLCDLGIAKQIQGELAKTLTATGEGFYTAPYVSPEQLEGKKLDIRCDIYSLGVTLYEMVAGRLPFTGENSQEIASKRLTQAPPPPKKWNPRISQNLNNLILRMMARNRDQRYANSAQLIRAIRYLRGGGHISAPPNPYIKWVALATVLLIAIISITVMVSGGEREDIKYLNLGKSKSDNGKYKEAIEDCDKAIELNPNYAEAYVIRGDAKDSLDDHKGAIRDYSKAIELNPKYAEAYYSRGATKDELGDYKSAVDDYDEAIMLNPKDADAYWGRGNANNKLGNYKEAIEDWEGAIKLDSSFYKDSLQPAIDKAKVALDKERK